MNAITKKVALSLVGLNGNACALVGAFKQQARCEGWAKDEIDAVAREALSGNYQHVLSTLLAHTTSGVSN